jgi:hypothetical protein
MGYNTTFNYRRRILQWRSTSKSWLRRKRPLIEAESNLIHLPKVNQQWQPLRRRLLSVTSTNYQGTWRRRSAKCTHVHIPGVRTFTNRQLDLSIIWLMSVLFHHILLGQSLIGNQMAQGHPNNPPLQLGIVPPALAQKMSEKVKKISF